MVALSLIALAGSPTFATLLLPSGAVGATASALSDDGRVVYGRARFGETEGTWRPCRWVAGRVETLPLPERIDSGGDSIEVADTVGKGRIAVGTVATMKGDRACRWIDGKLELLPLPEGTTSAIAVAAAGGGTTVGTVQLKRQWRTVVWRLGKASVLPFPVGHSGLMIPKAISADGRTIVGDVDAKVGPGRRTWEWKAGRGVRTRTTTRLFRELSCGLSADGRTSLLVHQGAEGEAGATVLERPRSYVYPDPKGSEASLLSLPRMDATWTAVVLNVMRRSDGARSSLLWTEETGARELRTILGKTMPTGGVVSRLSGVARAAGGRVVVVGSLEDGRPFSASVPSREATFRRRERLR